MEFVLDKVQGRADCLAPDLAATIHAVVGVPVPATAEISMVFYLLIIGVKLPTSVRT